MRKSARMLLLALFDALGIYIIGLLGSAIILNGDFSLDYLPQWTRLVLLILPVQIVINYFLGLYSRVWRYASVAELVNVIKASTWGGLALCVAVFARSGFSLGAFRAVPLYWLLTTGVVGGMRFAIRIRRELVTDQVGKGARSLIVGAGDAGYILLKEIEKHPELDIKPVGLLDDDPGKQGMRIAGVTVVGSIADLKEAIEEYDVKQVVLAMPSAEAAAVREVVSTCRSRGVAVRTMPGLYELVSGAVAVSRIREVQIEDLLHREQIKVDFAEISNYITGKRVMVTGAGGSIGSELCRQILRSGPAELMLLGHGENSIFAIHRELLGRNSGVPLVPIIADVQSTPRILSLFKKHRPQVVFHAAAHKHVPLMEANAVEAIKNNVWGTCNVAEASCAVGVERFVLISTDKAVNPTSVMGATKRAAELVIQKLGCNSGTKFMAVRFGNVLGSRGSVVPIFKEQIARGGPVKVTHPEMVRYFMTIPEAVSLVLQAGAMGNGGELFVLDMGKPVSIVDMARDLITLSGFKPGEDIKIEFTGLRPGEKLYEELLTAEEGTRATKNSKIMVARQSEVDMASIDAMIDALGDMVRSDTVENQRVIELIQTTAQSGSGALAEVAVAINGG